MLPEPDPALCRALADDLHDAGFFSEALRSAWGETADNAIARGLRSPAMRALGDRADALAVLGRLLVLGMPQPIAAVDQALPTLGAVGLERLGLCRIDGDVVPQAIIRPQSFTDDRGSGQWWIASDLDEAALGGPLPEDHVLGVGGASLTLAGLQLPTPAGRALDLGAGCGIQSLRARRDVAEVVATDISDRALRFTRLNALLNGMTGIRTLRGSLFEPVRGERFDRVVSNPPFVITPRVRGFRRTSTATAGCRATTWSPRSSAGSARTSSPAASRRCSATGRAAAGPWAWIACASGSSPPTCRWTRGSSNARASTPSRTPNCGCATAAPCPGRRSTPR